jgi:prepilin-type N-terminal cleavage/methylation domain-containing protein
MFTQRGFTFVEVLVTLAVFSILGAMAAPSFSEMLARQKLNQAATEMATSMMQARSQAAVKRLPTAICLNNKNNGTETTVVACASANIPNYSTLDAAQKLSAQQNRTFLLNVPKGVTIGSSTTLVFQPTGIPAAGTTDAARTFSFCKNGTKREVSVSITGSVSNKKGTC